MHDMLHPKESFTGNVIEIERELSSSTLLGVKILIYLSNSRYFDQDTAKGPFRSRVKLPPVTISLNIQL